MMDAFLRVVPPVVVDRAPSTQNVLQGTDIDLERFPAPRWHPLDVGRYVGTLGVVVTQDPDTGQRNAAIYRQEVLGRNKTGVVLGRDALVTLQKYQALRRPMPIATCLGAEPSVLASAVMAFSYGQDELGMAGALRGEALPVVSGKTVDLLVPTNCEFVFEGYVSLDPSDWLEEGPFGEFTGYYAGERTKRPTVELTAITHRDQPMLQGTLEGRAPSESDVLISVGAALALKANLNRMGVPGIKDVWSRGRAYVAIISLDRQYYAGHARQVIDAVLSTTRFKWIVVVDGDVNVFNWDDVEWALATSVQPHRDVVVTDDRRRGNSLDPSIPADRRSIPINQSSKIGIDATTQYKTAAWPTPVRQDPAMRKHVLEHWEEYGISLTTGSGPGVGIPTTS